MAKEKRVGKIRRKSRLNVNAVDPIPSGSTAGFYCKEYTNAQLRIRPSTPGTTTYTFEVYNFEEDSGPDWFEDPTERRSVNGKDYVRNFRVGTDDRAACRITDVSDAVDVFWTFS